MHFMELIVIQQLTDFSNREETKKHNKWRHLLNCMYHDIFLQKKVVSPKIAVGGNHQMLASEQEDFVFQTHLYQTTEFWNYSTSLKKKKKK